MVEAPSRAKPLADEEFAGKVMDLVGNAAVLGQLKKGANEATKALNRGIAELIILAADTQPLEILLHLPLLCEDKNVPYLYVSSKADLGKACGTTRNVVAAAVIKMKDSKLNKTINKIKDETDRLFIESGNE
eukprot:CAMPEP_0176435318 /NCGR_PEP_ID=MMETSP0127-20121128/17237_1 /TAXON_ID=938130 /ORGANISM="Platyophrya macrostoma, Strain WH" /LENGTH=131 /DNA_ID=CAMNT_0017818295 /DNA_START=27 /DNA_END=422 /DNA_ORIENTATION=+